MKSRRRWRVVEEEELFGLPMPEAESGKLQLSKLPGKQARVAPTGQGATPQTHIQSQQCVNCGKGENWVHQCLRCSQCNTSYYCSKFCQREHWNEHRKLCQAISEVERRERGPMTGGQTLKTSFLAHLTPTQRSKLTKLVGRKCIVSCFVQGKKVNAL